MPGFLPRALVLLLAALMLGGCWNDYVWRQKQTVEVETPEGVKSGSSTVKVAWRDGIGLLPDPPSFTNRIRGEATVVDLGNDQYLFALLGGAERLAMRVFSDERLPDGTDALVPFAKKVLAQKGKSRQIEEEHYPLLVTFTDINDPTTVQRVDPDDLQASFGRGVRLKRITLAITDELVSEGNVGAVLGWLSTVGDEMLDGNRISTIKARNRLANDLTRLDFTRN